MTDAPTEVKRQYPRIPAALLEQGGVIQLRDATPQERAYLELLALHREVSARTHMISGRGQLTDAQIAENNAAWAEYHRKRRELLARGGLLGGELERLRKKEAGYIRALATIQHEIAELVRVQHEHRRQNAGSET